MTIAEKFYKVYTTVSYDYETGRKNWDEWDSLMKGIRKVATAEEEQSAGSWDPSIVFKFEDGSAICVDNPKQGAFDGVISLVF